MPLLEVLMYSEVQYSIRLFHTPNLSEVRESLIPIVIQSSLSRKNRCSPSITEVGNRAISVFSGQKACTKIMLTI